MKILPIVFSALLASFSFSNADEDTLLVRLYEEEVLAHDLYVALGKKFTDIMPLQHIPQSEKMHQEVMAGILKERGIDLPKPAKGARFVTEGLDATYKKWFKEGKVSAAAACRVGVRLEDYDIADLIEAQKKMPEIKDVLGNLIAASENHLRAFHRNMTARGGSYDVEALPKADFDAILSGEGGCCGTCGKGDGPSKGKGKGSGNGKGKGPRNGKGQQSGKGKCACQKVD